MLLILKIQRMLLCVSMYVYVCMCGCVHVCTPMCRNTCAYAFVCLCLCVYASRCFTIHPPVPTPLKPPFPAVDMEAGSVLPLAKSLHWTLLQQKSTCCCCAGCQGFSTSYSCSLGCPREAWELSHCGAVLLFSGVTCPKHFMFKERREKSIPILARHL